MENLEEERIKVIAQLDEAIEFLQTIIIKLEAGVDMKEVLDSVKNSQMKFHLSADIFIISNLLCYLQKFYIILYQSFNFHPFSYYEKQDFITHYKRVKQIFGENKNTLQEQKIVQFHSSNPNQYIRQCKCFLYEGKVKYTMSFYKHTDIYLDFGDYSQFVVLLGDNAQGKTAILQNIVSDSFILCFKDNRPLPKYDLKYEEGGTEAEKAKREAEQIFLVGYSASRRIIQSEHNNISTDSLRASGTSHLLSDGALPLLNIETWLKNKRLDGFDDLVKRVCLMLANMTPECKSIELRGSKLVYTDIFGIENSFLDLSLGQRVTIALMGDIAIRLFDFQPEVEKVEDLQGIVLIDELELHLHAKWQRKFPTLLKTYLPKVQFIVSTHSPMIVLGMPENTCYFHVQKDQEGNIQAEKVEIDVKNMLAGQILTSPLFGLETVRHIDNQVDNRLTSLENAEKKADTPELQKGLQQLKDRLKKLKTNEENQ